MVDQLQVLLAEIVAALPVGDGARTTLSAQIARLDTGEVDDGQLLAGHESTPVNEPLAFTVIRPSFKSIFVAWNGDRVVSGHGYYELQISTSASEAGLLDTRKTSSTWTIFDALAANESTVYHFRIRAVDAAGAVGEWTDWSSEATTTQLSSSDGEELKSSNYVAGTSGWRIAGNGDAEFNDIEARGTLQSSNFDAGTDGWRITNAGAAEFNSVTIRNATGFMAELYADEGRIGQVGFALTGPSLEPSNSGDDLSLDADFPGQVLVNATAGMVASGSITSNTGLISLGPIEADDNITAGGTLIASGHETTAAGANCNISTAGVIRRDTSVRAAKADIAPAADDDLAGWLRLPVVTYRSVLPADDPAARHVGAVAEDVADVDRRLVRYDEAGNPVGLAYDRFGPVAVALVQSLERRVAALEGEAL